jgi:hypothetical protein
LPSSFLSEEVSESSLSVFWLRRRLLPGKPVALLLSPVLLEGFPHTNVFITLPFCGILLLLLPLGKKPVPLLPLAAF